MGEQDGVSQRDLETLLGTLRGWLHSEISISSPRMMTFDRDSRVHPPEQDGVEVILTVRNDAPSSFQGGEVVFTGVGLRISDGREQNTDRPTWVSGIRSNRPSDRQDLRERYKHGAWVGSRERFPALTSSEGSFGEVLFSGESVVYEMAIPESYLPYTNIQVEGSVSRRHLFRFVQPIQALERWTRPLLVETFRAFHSIDIYGPILAVEGAIPEFGPGTTLSDLDGFRVVIGRVHEHVISTAGQLNESFQSAPNRELRDHTRNVVGLYLRSVREACDKTLESLSSGDTEQMRAASDKLRQEVAASAEVYRKTLELMSRFGIASEEVDLHS